MGADVAIFEERNLAYIRYFGVVTPDVTLDAMRRILRDPRCRPTTVHLGDMSGADRVSASFQEILTLVNHGAGLSLRVVPGTRSACFAPDDMAFGVARMFHQMAESTLPYLFGVFRDEAGALKHLGQPETTISEFLRIAV